MLIYKKLLFLFVIVLSLLACSKNDKKQIICSKEWYLSVEKRVQTSDEQGHGPDYGSAEWKSVLEFKLGIRDDTNTPEPSTQEWCHYIENKIEQLQ